jgi:hypothetical protein
MPLRKAKAHAVGGFDAIVLESNLSPTGNLSAGFTRWQVLLGSESEKRMPFRVDQTSNANLHAAGTYR